MTTVRPFLADAFSRIRIASRSLTATSGLSNPVVRRAYLRSVSYALTLGSDGLAALYAFSARTHGRALRTTSFNELPLRVADHEPCPAVVALTVAFVASTATRRLRKAYRALPGTCLNDFPLPVCIASLDRIVTTPELCGVGITSHAP